MQHVFRKALATIAVSFAFICPDATMADMARDYLSTPVGSWYPAYYLTYSESKSPADGGKTVTSQKVRNS